jgi:hypothetical protein
MQTTASVSFGKTETGLRYVDAPAGAGLPFTETECDRILSKYRAQPLTPAERERVAEFLPRDAEGPS